MHQSLVDAGSLGVCSEGDPPRRVLQVGLGEELTTGTKSLWRPETHSEMNPDRVQEPGRSQRIHLDSTRGLGYMRGSFILFRPWSGGQPLGLLTPRYGLWAKRQMDPDGCVF